MPIYIINITRKTHMEYSMKAWPTLAELAEFASPLDVLELIEVSTELLSHHSLNYVKQYSVSYGMERINATGNGFIDIVTRANQWLQEQIKISCRRTLPQPKCIECREMNTNISEVQSIRDTGRCLTCRLPKPPKKEKKKKR